MVVGFKVRETIEKGVTVSGADCVTPFKVAPMVTLTLEFTGNVVTVNVAVVAPF